MGYAKFMKNFMQTLCERRFLGTLTRQISMSELCSRCLWSSYLEVLRAEIAVWLPASWSWRLSRPVALLLGFLLGGLHQDKTGTGSFLQGCSLYHQKLQGVR
jgi:hypothetical protein